MFALCTAVTRLRAAGLCKFKRKFGNAGRSRPGYYLYALDYAGHNFVLHPCVQVLGVLPHHHQVNVFVQALYTRQGPDRSDAGVQVQALPEGHVEAWISLDARRSDGPLQGHPVLLYGRQNRAGGEGRRGAPWPLTLYPACPNRSGPLRPPAPSPPPPSLRGPIPSPSIRVTLYVLLLIDYIIGARAGGFNGGEH